jgi:hypothetical protein
MKIPRRSWTKGPGWFFELGMTVLILAVLVAMVMVPAFPRWTLYGWPLMTLAWIYATGRWWREAAKWHRLYRREQAFVHQILGIVDDHEITSPVPPE